MAHAPTSEPASPEQQALYAERQRFWEGFCTATTASVVGVVVLLVLMAIFLL